MFRGYPITAHLNSSVDINGDAYNDPQVRMRFADSDHLIYKKLKVGVAKVEAAGAVKDSVAHVIGQVHLAVHHATYECGHSKMWLRAAAAPILVLQL